MPPVRSGVAALKQPTATQRREWARRLEADGFQDLESLTDPDAPLSNRGMPEFAREANDERAARTHDRLVGGDFEELAAYYRAARALVHDRAWSDPAERTIWLMHAEGHGIRTIVRSTVRDARGRPAAYHRVEAVIQRVRAELLGHKRRRGRPRKNWGFGQGATWFSVRLDHTHEVLLDRIRAAGGNPAELVRLAIRTAAGAL